MSNFDVLSVIVIIFDLNVAGFLLWRILDKKATLWGASKIIYWWVIFLSLYHCGIYIVSMFIKDPEALIVSKLHPIVLLYVLNPLLIAIIHWRGGRLFK